MTQIAPPLFANRESRPHVHRLERRVPRGTTHQDHLDGLAATFWDRLIDVLALHMPREYLEGNRPGGLNPGDR